MNNIENNIEFCLALFPLACMLVLLYVIWQAYRSTR